MSKSKDSDLKLSLNIHKTVRTTIKVDKYIYILIIYILLPIIHKTN